MLPENDGVNLTRSLLDLWRKGTVLRNFDVNGTSNNTNSISTLDTGFSDPPTLADLEALRSKLNEMILNGRRWGAWFLVLGALFFVRFPRAGPLH